MVNFKFSHFYKYSWVFNYNEFQVICYDLLENTVEDVMSYRDILFIFARVDIYKKYVLKKTIYTEYNLEVPFSNN